MRDGRAPCCGVVHIGQAEHQEAPEGPHVDLQLGPGRGLEGADGRARLRPKVYPHIVLPASAAPAHAPGQALLQPVEHHLQPRPPLPAPQPGPGRGCGPAGLHLPHNPCLGARVRQRSSIAHHAVPPLQPGPGRGGSPAGLHLPHHAHVRLRVRERGRCAHAVPSPQPGPGRGRGPARLHLPHNHPLGLRVRLCSRSTRTFCPRCPPCSAALCAHSPPSCSPGAALRPLPAQPGEAGGCPAAFPLPLSRKLPGGCPAAHARRSCLVAAVSLQFACEPCNGSPVVAHSCRSCEGVRPGGHAACAVVSPIASAIL